MLNVTNGDSADRIADARIVLVGQDGFRGVAELSDDEIGEARPEPFDLTPYRALWKAFTAPDPRCLDRSQRALLHGAPAGGAPFMGDVIAFDYLQGRVHPRAARYDPATRQLV